MQLTVVVARAIAVFVPVPATMAVAAALLFVAMVLPASSYKVNCTWNEAELETLPPSLLRP